MKKNIIPFDKNMVKKVPVYEVIPMKDIINLKHYYSDIYMQYVSLTENRLLINYK